MKLVAFGSSHTTGYKLKDIADAKVDQISAYAYPSVTANILEWEYANYARTGNSIDQIYTDVFGYLAESTDDDFIIIQLPVNPTWFRLITADNQSVNIVKPESLDYKGKMYRDALHSYLGKLTGDNHFNRIWYIYFYSLINLLHSRNKKFIWFFDSYSVLWEEYDTIISKMPESIQIEIHKIRKASPDPKLTYIDKFFSDYLFEHIPKSFKPCGHYDEDGHRFWAEKVLVPAIKSRLTAG
jgi:hypothetical protein